MKIAKKIIFILIIILGLSSGIAKVLVVERELDFFISIGLDKTILVLFGLIQSISSFSLIFYKFRKIGIIILALTFIASTIFLLIDKQFLFGFLSLIPILLMAVIFNLKMDRTNK